MDQKKLCPRLGIDVDLCQKTSKSGELMRLLAGEVAVLAPLPARFVLLAVVPAALGSKGISRLVPKSQSEDAGRERLQPSEDHRRALERREGDHRASRRHRTLVACNPFPARNVDRSYPVPGDASQKVERVESKIDSVCVHVVKVEEKLSA